MTNLAAMLMFQSDTAGSAAAGAAAAGAGIFAIIYLAIILLIVISLWKLFVKAGEPGWAAIVPIYNLLIILKIAGKPAWWFILMLIPFVNIIILIIVLIAFASAYGKGVGFAIGMLILPFIFYPMLAFGDSTYHPLPAA
ncbi:MAG TPA: DUF5684 domain-containing protein [Thermoanaerobaculia bacterium]|nr:DUF5684 domain-containing protein [Thermoanaerobaculia bacterium]